MIDDRRNEGLSESEEDLPTLPFERPDILDIAPLYRRLQAERPITRVRTMVGDVAWLVTRYADVKALLADDRLGRSHPDPSRAARVSDAVLLGGPMGDYRTEKSGHDWMRRALTPSFSARRVKALRPRVQDLVDDLFDRLARQTPPADFHEAVSFPLPVLVICELLGVPYADRERFRAWSDDIASLHDRSRSRAALQSLTAYMTTLVDRKRVEPAEDVMSDLIAAQAMSQGVDNTRVAQIAASLLFAGHETTVARIDFGVLLLLAHPAQRGALQRDPDLAGRAVEEILRFAVPGGATPFPRYAHADLSIGGVTIRAGDAVLLALGVANRDPDVFGAPDRFDVGREANPHLAFGHGAHFCIGASLARVELHAVFQTVLQRFPQLRQAVSLDDLRPRGHLLTGGIETLPVTW